MDLNKDYITIILEDKVFSQRTPNSKFTEFDLEGVKQNSYDELPYEIKKIIDTIKNMEQNPDNFFKYEEVEDGIKITSIDNVNVPYIRIPEFINGKPVKYLGYEATMNIRFIEQIHLPKTIEALPQYGFKGLTKLRYINIPEKVKEIPNECFANCYLLKQINLENIKHIGAFAFDQCASLKEINLSNIITLNEHAFNNCVNITTANITGPITQISNASFNNCINLENLTLSKTISIIQNQAFANCGLKEFISPEGLVGIAYGAFKNNKIKYIHLNKKLKNIGEHAFTENNTEYIYMYSNTEYKASTFDSKNIIILDRKIEIER